MKMMFNPICWYYGRYIPPYVEGVLQAWKPTMCRRLQRHIARCATCRSAVAAGAATHLRLRDWARQARTEDVWSTPERGSWRRSSLSDRVSRHIVAADRAARHRTLLGQFFAVAAGFIVLSIVVTQPTTAREWIYHRLFSEPNLVRSAPATDVAHVTQTTAPIRDPFLPQIALTVHHQSASGQSDAAPTSYSASPILSSTVPNVAPLQANGPSRTDPAQTALGAIDFASEGGDSSSGLLQSAERSAPLEDQGSVRSENAVNRSNRARSAVVSDFRQLP